MATSPIDIPAKEEKPMPSDAGKKRIGVLEKHIEKLSFLLDKYHYYRNMMDKIAAIPGRLGDAYDKEILDAYRDIVDLLAKRAYKQAGMVKDQDNATAPETVGASDSKAAEASSPDTSGSSDSESEHMCPSEVDESSDVEINRPGLKVKMIYSSDDDDEWLNKIEDESDGEDFVKIEEDPTGVWHMVEIVEELVEGEKTQTINISEFDDSDLDEASGPKAMEYNDVNGPPAPKKKKKEDEAEKMDEDEIPQCSSDVKDSGEEECIKIMKRVELLYKLLGAEGEFQATKEYFEKLEIEEEMFAMKTPPFASTSGTPIEREELAQIYAKVSIFNNQEFSGNE